MKEMKKSAPSAAMTAHTLGQDGVVKLDGILDFLQYSIRAA